MEQQPQSLEDAIKAFLEHHGLSEEAAIQELISRWDQVMGKPIAQATEKVWFRAGVLYVRLNSPVWKSELQMGRSKLRTMLNEQMGQEIIREVKIV